MSIIINKRRHLEYIFIIGFECIFFFLIIGFECIFFFLTIFPSAVVKNVQNDQEKSLQYSSTIICQGFFEACCSPWTTHCVTQKMTYWENNTTQSATAFQTTQIFAFLLHLVVASVVILIFCRHRTIVRRKMTSNLRVGCIRTSYFLAAISTVLAFVVTEHTTQPFGAISRRNFVMTIEFIIPPLLLLLAGITAQN